MRTTQGIGNVQGSVAAPDQNFLPSSANQVFDVYAIRLLASVLAAGREADVLIYDGTNNIPIWKSGAAGIASGDDYLIWPVDLSTLMLGAAGVIGLPPLRLTNSQYLRLDTTGLAAAETIDLYFHFTYHDIGGL